jgi:hypothetical protein
MRDKDSAGLCRVRQYPCTPHFITLATGLGNPPELWLLDRMTVG